MAKKVKQHVLVTTKHRSVFFGELKSEEGTTVELCNARNAIRFGTTKGFLELADTGPTKNSKIGAVAPELKLHDVTSITKCSLKSVEKWLLA